MLTAGFAMFSMFFGSGNLVFPLLMGSQTLSQCGYATLGLLLTGVLVPFLGLLAIVLYNGDRVAFFSHLGKKPGLWIAFFILAVLAPLGSMPRCITVAYGGTQQLFPGCSLFVFSLLFSIVTAMTIWRHDRVVNIIGKFLTPALLASIFTIITVGLIRGDAILESAVTSGFALKTGLLQGYQTQDLCAAFFFAAATIEFLRKSSTGPRDLFKASLGASLIGAGLLGVVYIGFVLLGAKFSPILGNIEPNQLLTVIAAHTLGPVALPIAAIAILLACLSTAAVLCDLFADFIRNELFPGALSRGESIVLTLTFTFLMSLLGFNQICAFIGNVLEIAYPALIAYSLACLLGKLFAEKQRKLAFWTILGVSATMKVFVLV